LGSSNLFGSAFGTRADPNGMAGFWLVNKLCIHYLVLGYFTKKMSHSKHYRITRKD